MSQQEIQIAPKEYKNAVLDDLELQGALKTLNSRYGDLITRMGGRFGDYRSLTRKPKH
ncbi:MAG: hypothetical protein KDJ70_12650 [Candidatus Competibacteraceae bacterium]|nr:hypothetical protein [Candidatus Competibacteraceae bacterium]